MAERVSLRSDVKKNADQITRFECFVQLERLSVESNTVSSSLNWIDDHSIEVLSTLITGFFLLKYNIKECYVPLERVTARSEPSK